MLAEHEQAQLAELVDVYGPKGVVDCLVTVLEAKAEALRTESRGAAFGHDAIVLARVVRALWVGGRGRG